eukprot:1157239-Amphidinium_carterae.1
MQNVRANSNVPTFVKTIRCYDWFENYHPTATHYRINCPNPHTAHVMTLALISQCRVVPPPRMLPEAPPLALKGPSVQDDFPGAEDPASPADFS